MPLGFRQRRLYKNTVTLYRPNLTRSGSTGRPSAKTWSVAYTGVKCLFGKRDSTSGPSPGGRQETDNMFSHDEVHVAADQEIGENWLILDQSIDRNGERAASYGSYWIVIGEPKTWSDYGGRRAGHKAVQANRHTVPHHSITD